MNTKALLRRLIMEVIKELDDKDVEVSPENLKGTPDTMQNLQRAQQTQHDTTIKLTTKGLKTGKAYKKAMAVLAYAAKMADLEVIRGEVEKDGKPLFTMDASDLKTRAKQFGSDDKAFKATGERGKINMARLSPDQRLSMMQPGEKEGEWKQATDNDVVAAREKTKLKNAKIKAGTYNKNDTTLWTDAEWDAYNTMISKGAPQDNEQWNEQQWAEFDNYLNGEGSPNYSTKVDKPLAGVGAGLGNISQTS